MTAFSLNFNLPDGATIEIGDWGIPDYDSEKAAEGKDMIHEWQRAGKALDEAIERAKLVVAHKDAVRKHKKACADVENARYALDYASFDEQEAWAKLQERGWEYDVE
jgi:hypothetical protein